MTQAMVAREHKRPSVWRAAVCALAALCLFGSAVMAAGAIQDDGNLFSQSARNDFTTREAQIERDTGKQVVVRTVASLNGKDISAQADAAFAQLNVNGVLIYASKADKSLSLKIGQTTRQAISTQEEGQIRDQMLASFRTNDFDGGLLNATDRIGRNLRAVFTNTTSGANANRGNVNQPATTATNPAPRTTGGGIGLGAILVILVLIVAIYFVVHRLLTRPRPSYDVGGGSNYGGGGTNYAPPPGPGYGPNYGPNYGGGYPPQQQGGGGFGSSVAGGAVGGFGGAILGNAVYDHFRDEHGNDRNGNPVNGGNVGNPGPYQDPNNDRGRVDDSYQDTGSYGSTGDSGSGSSGSDAGTGSWGDSGASAGDSGGSSDSGTGSWG